MEVLELIFPTCVEVVRCLSLRSQFAFAPSVRFSIKGM